MCENAVLEAFLVVVSSWPLDGLSQRTARVRARAKAGHMALRYHTQKPWPLSLLPPLLHRQIREVRPGGWVDA